MKKYTGRRKEVENKIFIMTIISVAILTIQGLAGDRVFQVLPKIGQDIFLLVFTLALFNILIVVPITEITFKIFIKKGKI